MLYIILFTLAIGLAIGALTSSDWIIYRENNVDIGHGLFETCLDKDINNDDSVITCVSHGIDKKFNIYLPTVMILSSLVVMAFAQTVGGFLYFIIATNGTKIIGFWVMGVFSILTGLVIIASSSLVITLPLLDDDIIMFAKELSRIIDPQKVYRKGFFICWASGLALMCSGIVAISNANSGHYRYIALPNEKK